MNTGIIVAAGRGERMGVTTDKAFLSLGSRPVLAYSMMAFEACPDIDAIILVVRREQQVAARGVARMFGCAKVRSIVIGGKMRQDSVWNGLEAVDPETRLVAVHDAARPMITPLEISATLASAKRYGSGVAARKTIDTVKFVERGSAVDHTLDRDKIWTVQTPQAFKLSLLTKALKAVIDSGESVTDEAGALEKIGESVRLVECADLNLKITKPEDLQVIAALMKL